MLRENVVVTINYYIFNDEEHLEHSVIKFKIFQNH